MLQFINTHLRAHRSFHNIKPVHVQRASFVEFTFTSEVFVMKRVDNDSNAHLVYIHIDFQFDPKQARQHRNDLFDHVDRLYFVMNTRSVLYSSLTFSHASEALMQHFIDSPVAEHDFHFCLRMGVVAVGQALGVDIEASSLFIAVVQVNVNHFD